jgi:Maintenance of mitochondrial structure and function
LTNKQRPDVLATSSKGWTTSGTRPCPSAYLLLYSCITASTAAQIGLHPDKAFTCAARVEQRLCAVVHVVEGVPQTVFAKAAYNMATSDAERIGVNAAANVIPSGAATESALSQHCSSLHSALQMLSERVQIIHAFCLEMQEGKVPVDHQV